MACVSQAVIGFSGEVPAGLIVHPSNKFVLYPLGSTVVIRDLGAQQSQRFLRGHSDAVSCIAVSPSGRYVASGQVTYMGFQVLPLSLRHPLRPIPRTHPAPHAPQP